MGSCSSRPAVEEPIGAAWPTEERSDGGQDNKDEMPFFKKDSKKEGKEKVNYKARLEHKQYLAQESPEPIYDLSDCALKNVPAGIYYRCKVARKEALLLQENELTVLTGGGSLADLSHIQVLDLHKNCLEKIPEDIGLLKNLKVLYLQENRLKCLPPGIGKLTNLETLNLQANSLKEVPVSISNLTGLKTLDLRNNPKLKTIPKEFAALRCLETLLLDPGLTYPATDIIDQGTEAVMRFLCSECSMDYIPPSQARSMKEQNGTTSVTNGTYAPSDPYEDLIKGHLDKVEQQKQEKRRAAQELEEQRLRDQEKEIELKRQSQENKRKLLSDMAEEETKKDGALMEFQRLRESERKEITSKMFEAEQQSDLVISRLMQSGLRYSDPAKMMATLEADRAQMEAQFTLTQEDVEKLKAKEVLRAMQEEMETELQRAATRRQYEQRQGIVQQALCSSLENDRAVEEALSAKGKQQGELIAKMLEDEKYQKEAFQALLLRQDHRATEIQDQMGMIQNELAALTMVEMKKRDLKVEFELELMSEKRDKLTSLLLVLMERQKQRAEDLHKMMGEMETTRVEEQENYWLIQYQKLLDSKPKGLAEAEHKLDRKVKELLTSCGAKELIPLFAAKKISLKELSFMTDKDLKEAGVTSASLRSLVLVAVTDWGAAEDRARLKLEGGESEDRRATAPPDDEPVAASAPEDDSPSAPPVETFHSAECVICLERKCDIIFLPCGHLCSCYSCEPSVANCPLCRAAITQRVRL